MMRNTEEMKWWVQVQARTKSNLVKKIQIICSINNIIYKQHKILYKYTKQMWNHLYLT